MIISLTELMRTIQTEKSLVVDFPTMLPLLHLLNHLIVLVGLVIIYTLLSLPLNCLNFLVVGDGLVLIIESRVSLKMGIFSCTRRLTNNRNFCFFVVILICMQYFETMNLVLMHSPPQGNRNVVLRLHSVSSCMGTHPTHYPY